MPLTWNPSMTTGMQNLDDQHKELFAQVNNLLAAMSRGAGKDELGKTLDFLGSYAVKHFQQEEAAMASRQCPAAAANKLAHQRFLQVFGALQDEIRRDGPTTVLVLKAQRELSGWLSGHIAQIDTQLAPCLHKKAG
jgi:hemerythrin